MAETPSKVPVKNEAKGAGGAGGRRSEAVAHPLQSLREQVDRLFEDFASGLSHFPFGRRVSEIEPFWRSPTSTGLALPAVDVVEKEDAFKISAELPGMEDKEIDLTLANDVLTIKGEKKEEKEEKRRGYYRAERRYGSFQRSFRLPESVNQDKIEASFEKGVLTIVLPKSEEARKREKRIAIKAK